MNKIDINDIEQGSLGDCWFLSALASVAENPDRVKRLFDRDVKSEHGGYGIFIYVMGIPVKIVVDDYLPYDPANECLALAGTPRNEEMWVSLIEKAFAKLHKRYDCICGG